MNTKVNSFQVADLFTGTGGFGLGFHLAGYNLVCSVEKDKWAAETLRQNGIYDVVVEADIRTKNTKKQIENVCKVTPDIIIGGPPCQGFSVAGPARKKDPKDPRNSLFKDFARWVEHFDPQIFVMENVKGILTRKNAKQEMVIDIIQQTFEKLDYKVEIWQLNAAYYGVPQIRERVFIVGHKLEEQIGVPPPTHFIASQNDHDDPISYQNLCSAICINDAVSDLPYLDAGGGEEEQEYTDLPQSPYQKWARGQNSTLFNHVAMKHTQRIVERFKRIQNGELLANIPEEYKVRKRNGDGTLSDTEYDSNYRHLKPDEISYTIPASFYSSFIHPHQPRNITAREAARIQSFPDWYRIMGKRTIVSSKLLQKKGRHDEDYLSQYNQIGNAVPPLLAKAIAEHLLHLLNS